MSSEIIKKIAATLLLGLLLVGCRKGETSSPGEYSATLYEPQYASGFRILGAEGRRSTVLETYNPWQGADDVVSRVFLRRGGEAVPEDFVGQVVEADSVGRLIGMSSSYVGMLAALGESRRIVGVSGLRYVCDSVVASRSDVAEVGYEAQVDYETIVALRPDAVLFYGVGSANPMEPKLKALKVPYIYVADYLEESPLGKAEWVVAMAEILGCRQRGEEIFAAIPKRYFALKALADSLEEHPRVMLNTPYADSWVMPPSTSYFARLLKDAGALYEPPKSHAIDLEEAWSMARNADVWMNTGAYTSLNELKKTFPKFADTKPVTSGNVWNCHRRRSPGGGNDYWESGVVNPDLVLRDLIKILHPDVLPDRPFVYYQRL